MNNLKNLTPKATVYEGIFNDKWEATISYGEDGQGTIILPDHKDIGGFKTAIHLQAMGESEFAVSSVNFIPLLIYKVEKATGKVYNIKPVPINWGYDVDSEHWISTQAIGKRTNAVTTVTFTLCRNEGKNFTLTLIED